MPSPSLEQERLQFQQSPLLAMPIAGTIAWTVAGIAGAFLPVTSAAWVLFIATGSTFGLAVLIGKLTGENLLSGAANSFDRLFSPRSEWRAWPGPSRFRSSSSNRLRCPSQSAYWQG